MTTYRYLLILVVAIVTALAAWLSFDRSGVIAWTTLIAGVALLIKLLRKPSSIDTALAAGLVLVPAIVWIGVHYYVISTWETGEVVELAIETDTATHTARLWVLDIDEQPVVYYDADPDVAASLLAGRPLRLTRGDRVSVRVPHAQREDEVSEARANEVFMAMQRKYGERVSAADLFYVMLGRPRDRVAVVATLLGDPAA